MVLHGLAFSISSGIEVNYFWSLLASTYMHAPSSSSKPFSIHDLPLLPCQFTLECNQIKFPLKK
jgi:hypothetical protein